MEIGEVRVKIHSWKAKNLNYVDYTKIFKKKILKKIPSLRKVYNFFHFSIFYKIISHSYLTYLFISSASFKDFFIFRCKVGKSLIDKGKKILILPIGDENEILVTKTSKKLSTIRSTHNSRTRVSKHLKHTNSPQSSRL